MSQTVKFVLPAVPALGLGWSVFALKGKAQIHDPSIVVRCSVFNAVSATGICAWFLNSEGKPLKEFTMSVGDVNQP